MRKFLLLFTVVSVCLVSCSKDESKESVLITFEDVALTDGIWNGEDGSGYFVSKEAKFYNTYDGGFWNGFSCSSKTDTQTPGWENQYSSIVGSGSNASSQYAVIYDDLANFTTPTTTIKSLMISNSTYAYLDMKEGSQFSKKFEAEDWFKVSFTGYLNKNSISTVDYYLADFRNGKAFLSNTWEKVDLSVLGQVDSISISFDSSDKGQFGVNTPKYACIDNIELEY